MAIIILCFLSPSPKHRHDLHCHQLDTLISIISSWSSRQLLLLQLSLTHSDKVKQLHGVFISYNKETTIRLLPVSDNFRKHDHLIQQCISHHVLTISHHNIPCKNKLDVLYFVVASFTCLLRVSSKNHSYLRTKPQQCFVKFVVLTLNKDRPQSNSIQLKLEQQTPTSHLCAKHDGRTGLMNVVM